MPSGYKNLQEDGALFRKCFTKEVNGMYCLNCSKELSETQLKRKFQFCCKGCATSYRQAFIDPNISRLPDSDRYYILGLIWSDGNLSKDSKKLTISNNDESIISLIKPLFCDFRRRIYKRGKNFSLINTNKESIAYLISLGLISAKSLILRYPNNVDSKFEYAFIRGVFDGDGCVYISSKYKGKTYLNVSIASGSIFFLKAIQNTLLGNNIYSNITKDSRKTIKTYYLKIQQQASVKAFYNFIYQDNSNLFITYKKERFLNNNIV